MDIKDFAEGLADGLGVPVSGSGYGAGADIGREIENRLLGLIDSDQAREIIKSVQDVLSDTADLRETVKQIPDLEAVASCEARIGELEREQAEFRNMIANQQQMIISLTTALEKHSTTLESLTKRVGLAEVSAGW